VPERRKQHPGAIIEKKFCAVGFGREHLLFVPTSVEASTADFMNAVDFMFVAEVKIF